MLLLPPYLPALVSVRCFRHCLGGHVLERFAPSVTHAAPVKAAGSLHGIGSRLPNFPPARHSRIATGVALAGDSGNCLSRQSHHTTPHNLLLLCKWSATGKTLQTFKSMISLLFLIVSASQLSLVSVKLPNTRLYNYCTTRVCIL